MTLINYQGKQIEANEIEVITSNEGWNEYQLADGKVLKVKTVLISVCRASNEKDNDGQPLYLTKTSQIVRVK
jgi:hypothetical protein